MIKKVFFLVAFFASVVSALELDTTEHEKNEELSKAKISSIRVFGDNLFNGSFSKSSQHRYNPHYRINIGDTINIRLWGAFDFETTSSVDSQGNIFLPTVGTINLLGIKNEKLSQTIQHSVKKYYKESVHVYADLANYQPVNVFVTGAVKKPGLYEGLSSDSIVQFIDKAQGVIPENGSYRDIKILRENKVIHHVDLYSFLLSGSLELFQFHMGDVIVVESVGRYIEILGDVKRPYRYEIKDDAVTLRELMKVSIPNPTATNFKVIKHTIDNRRSSTLLPIMGNESRLIYAGQSIEFIPDHVSENITLNISGEHLNVHNIVLKRGAVLSDILGHIKLSDLSDIDSFQLFRKSVAQEQKQLIEAQLNDLEAKTLTSGSSSNEEAMIRKQEAQLVLNFIERARAVEPKGQVVINKDTNLSNIQLEDGDTLYIPKKSQMVLVQGEVMLPGAQTFVAHMSFSDYIESCGGYSFRADSSNVLIVQRNGKVIKYDDDSFFSSDYTVKPGDNILVLGKVDTKYLQAVKDITQVLYQIAVGAAVVLRF